jgi:plastocyanin
MGGARVLGIALLVLAAAIATPTFSSAQDPAAPAVPEPPATTPPPPLQAEPPADPADKDPAKKPEAGKDQGQGNQATALQPQPQPAPQPRSSGGQAQIAAAASVSVGDNFFSPASVSVAVGDTVSWRNNGQAQHSATANNGSFDTGVFGPGQSRSHTFNSAGTFSYFCTVHGQSQSGTVRVLAVSGGGGNGGGGSNQSEAAAVASPDAAGTSTTLPATGFAALGLALIGFVLLASGHLVKRLERDDEDGRRLFSIY